MKSQLETVGQQTDALIAAGYSAARKIPRGKIVSKATGAVVNARRRRDERLGARAVEEKCAGYLPIEPAVSKA